MKKKYIIVSIISILIMMVGVSFAYFSSDINVNKKEMNVSSKRLAIIFTDTKTIAEDEIMPGWETSKTFTVENKSGNVFYYDINIEDLVNTFVTTGYLQYKITSTDGGNNMESFIDIPKSSEARKEVLSQKIKIEDNEKHTYTIEFKYPNDPNVNQSEDMGMILSGSLSITESEIMVVKYKVDGVIQDELPSKEIPYIVNNVTCTNNAKGIWNEITETVELETPVKQTVCIVEFGEGYTVSMLTEHGEVVSPLSKVVGRIGTTTFNIEEKPGYSLSDAKVICDNGAEGRINNKVITITNIKQNNTCRVISNPVEITVTYNVNGGNTLSPTSKTVIYTGTYGSLPTPTRTGYTFNGWYTSSSGGQKIEESTEVTSTVNHTIYAHWGSNTINLTLNNQSATTGGSTNVYYRYNTATYYENSGLVNVISKITVPTRTGYTFGGYYTVANGGGTQYINASGAFVNNPHTNISSNTTLYAKWTVNTYTVTYNSNGGSTPSPASNRINYGAKYTLPASPSMTGYTFAGWWTASSGGTQVTTNTTLTNASDHNIYAHWNINSYNVTLKVTNGTPTNETKPVEYNKSTTFTIKANSGYKLEGATISCAGGSYNESTGVLTVSNITSDRTCTITLAQSKVTFTMTSTCFDSPNNNSSPCYILAHWKGAENNHYGCNISADWDGKATHNGKTYKNCTINSYNIQYGGYMEDPDTGRCKRIYFYSDNTKTLCNNGKYRGWWSCNFTYCGDDDMIYNTSCQVELTCDPA